MKLTEIEKRMEGELLFVRRRKSKIHVDMAATGSEILLRLAIFLRTFVPMRCYIVFAGQPAMELNASQNKRYGPGGGTRRLHHYQAVRQVNGFVGAK